MREMRERQCWRRRQIDRPLRCGVLCEGLLSEELEIDGRRTDRCFWLDIYWSASDDDIRLRRLAERPVRLRPNKA